MNHPWEYLDNLTWRGPFIARLLRDVMPGAVVVDMNAGEMPVAQALAADHPWKLYYANDKRPTTFHWEGIPGLWFSKADDKRFVETDILRLGMPIDIALFLGVCAGHLSGDARESQTEYASTRTILHLKPKVVVFEAWACDGKILRVLDEHREYAVGIGYTVATTSEIRSAHEHGKRKIIRLNLGGKP